MGGSPFVVGTGDLVRRPGSRRPVRRAGRFDGAAISTAAVAAGQDVVVDLELEAISNGVVAEGTLAVPWTGACRRCLDEVRGTATVEVREVFERRPVEGETYPLGHDVVDLEPMVRDAVVLALPLAPLCAEGCAGPDPANFPATADDGGPAPGPERPPDPRWAALDQVRFD